MCLKLFQISLTSSADQSVVTLQHSKINTHHHHHHVICAKATWHFKITTSYLCAQNKRPNIMSPSLSLVTANNDQYLNDVKCPDTVTLTGLKYQLVIEDRESSVCRQTASVQLWH